MTNIIHCFFYPRHAFLMIRNNHDTIHRLKNLMPNIAVRSHLLQGVDRLLFSSHFMRNSFSSLIWSSISLNSGVFITSAFRCFLITFFRYRRHASLFSSVTNDGHCSP